MKIFVALSTFAEYDDAPLKLLEQSGFSYSVNPLGKRLTRDEVVELGGDCEGVIAGVEPYDDRVLERMPNLRCISRCGVGLDNISLEKAQERGITILNTPDVVVQPVAELTVAMILDLLRKLSFHTGLVKAHRWEKKSGSLLAGKKAGILGLGRIGKRVAEILLKLDCSIYGTDLEPDVAWAREKKVTLVEFDELLASSDILSLHLAIVKDHPLRLSDLEFRKMKKGALLVNTARGQIVDEHALYAALKDGHLGGAALDVFPEEPYRGILCELDHVVLTPHISTLTMESRAQMEREATQNIIHFFDAQSFETL